MHPVKFLGISPLNLDDRKSIRAARKAKMMCIMYARVVFSEKKIQAIWRRITNYVATTLIISRVIGQLAYSRVSNNRTYVQMYGQIKKSHSNQMLSIQIDTKSL